MTGPSWLVDSRRIASKIKNASEQTDPTRAKWLSNPTRPCPNCNHLIDNSDVVHEWPGLPKGVKFDPSDQELLWHLLAKAGKSNAKPHPFVDEFIPTVDQEEGICYTHPERLPGVKQDGSVSHFFHQTFKAYNTGTRKRRKINTDDVSGDVRWHKTGKTKPVLIEGEHLGCKKIMVLYVSSSKGGKPEKTNWVMHQYHLGTDEDEKDGQYVVSKLFYQQQQGQKVVEKNNAQDLVGVDMVDDKVEVDLDLGMVDETVREETVQEPPGIGFDPLFYQQQQQQGQKVVEKINAQDLVDDAVGVDLDMVDVPPKLYHIDETGHEETVQEPEIAFEPTAPQEHVNVAETQEGEDPTEQHEIEKPDHEMSQPMEESKGYNCEGQFSQDLMDSQQLAANISVLNEFLFSQSQSQSQSQMETTGLGEEDQQKRCLVHYVDKPEELKKDLEECVRGINVERLNCDAEKVDEFRLSQLDCYKENESQDGFLTSLAGAE